MKKSKLKLVLLPLLPFLVALLVLFIGRHSNITLLNPEGFIAIQEKNLIVTAISLMLILALPVIAIMFYVVWRYSDNNPKAQYTPEWTGNIFLKVLWWAILSVYVVIFSFIVWDAAHRLDPYKPIASSAKPITVQVVALQWKWLFIYPEQHIATINFLQFPAHTPVNFQLTADAPMSSFWIPSLGSQIYAMSSMQTQLHLISDKTGDFQGETTEINGSGYAGMKFTTRVSSQADFEAWVKKIQKANKPLTLAVFNKLDQPSEDNPVVYYSSVDGNLYNTIMMKYMPKVQIETHK